MSKMDLQDEKQEMAGKLEKLENQVRQLLTESKEIAFTEYLRRLTERVRNQVYQTDLLQDELDRSYRAYLQRQEAQAAIPLQGAISPQGPTPAPLS